MTDFKYTKHLKHSLGYDRKDMPQIEREDLMEFVLHFLVKEVGMKFRAVPANKLKPSQTEFSEKKIVGKIKEKSQQYKERLFIVSKEWHLLDGQHDWAYALEKNEDFELHCLVVDLPAKELIKRSKLLKLSGRRDVNDNNLDKSLLFLDDLLKAAVSKYGEGKKRARVAVRGAKGRVYYRNQEVGTQKKEKKAPWWSKFKEYDLNAYPVGVEAKDVELNVEGDMHTHWVMKWKDPKTGRTKLAYTREFLRKNAEHKWARIASLKSDRVEGLKAKTDQLLSDPDYNRKDEAAIISIIAHTGLRPGSKRGLEDTGNRGVSTLSVDNVTVDGPTVYLNFTGKSYQENTAVIENPVLAKYLSEKKANAKEGELIFQTSRTTISKTFKDDLGMGDYKIKDLRTYVATDKARDILFKDTAPPPPIPEKAKDLKKMVKEKLAGVYEKVSQQLNNTPAMAKNSYVHPAVVQAWAKRAGIAPELVKGEVDNNIPTLDEIIAETTNFMGVEHELDDYSEEMCDQYPLPSILS